MIETLIDLVPAQAIAEFPVNTFLESIVGDADNTLFITSHYEGKVFRISIDGAIAPHAAIVGKATGLALTRTAAVRLGRKGYFCSMAHC